MARPLLVFVLLLSGARVARGQSSLDGFDPNANGAINVVVVQSDGKVLIGGEFTSLSPNGGTAVGRNRIARLYADGGVDADFNPNANGSVHAIAVQQDGRILVGGSFTGANSIGGQTRAYFARLDPVSGAADAFNASASNVVRAVAVQPDGKILVGGDFLGVGSAARNRIARLDPVTALADSFDPNANNVVRSISLLGDGSILAGGDFTTLTPNGVGVTTRNRIARLKADGALDTAFNANAGNIVRAIAPQADGKVLVGGDFFGANSIGGAARNRIARLDASSGAVDLYDPNANGSVRSIVFHGDGKVLVGGLFSQIGGQSRNHLARLDPSTGLADSFNPAPNATSVHSIAIQQDGKILAGGDFTSLSPNGGTAVTRNRIARLESDGRLDRTLNLGISAHDGTGIYPLSAIATQPDGRMIIGGAFMNVLGVARSRIARLNVDGTLDTVFNPNASGHVLSIALQPDGRVLVGGSFTNIGGTNRNRIARLDPVTGSADSFDPNADDIVFSIASQANGNILAGGRFTRIGGTNRNRIARLDPATGVADSFNPNASAPVNSIVIQPDNKILVGGEFGSIGGQPRGKIARLDPDTGGADSFDPSANGVVQAIALQSDGKILAGGYFNFIGGQFRPQFARLNAATGGADSFNPNPDNAVFSIAVQSDGRILAGGDFTFIGGRFRSRIARLEAETGQADFFDPNADSQVSSIALQPDGRILAGGYFGNIGGRTRIYFARLANDTPALQTLAVSQTAISWMRSGSSPAFARVIFEHSTDGTNFTFLGNGMAAGNAWSLSGLNFPLGQYFYIRARGYARGGYQNASDGIAETVKRVFVSNPDETPHSFLTIQLLSNTNIVLSWPTNFSGFSLVSNTGVNAGPWNAVASLPSIVGTNHTVNVTNFLNDPGYFFRLRK